MSLFAKASAKAKIEEPKAKADAPRYSPDNETTLDAIDEYVTAKADKTKAENRMKVADGIASPWARNLLIKQFAERGSQPDTFWVKGKTEEAQFIAQDRTGQYNITDATLDTLKTILGVPRAESLIDEITEYSLDTAVLNLPGVADAISKTIESIPKEILSDTNKEALIKAKPKRILKKTLFQRLPELCSGSAEMMTNVLDAIGSSFVTYLK
jgi:hypothetical protein